MDKKKFILIVIPTVENAYHSFKDFVAITLPMGILSIAAIAEQKGYQVQIIDGDAEELSSDELIQRLAEERPEYVGSTCMTATMDITYDFYSRLKEKLPDVKIITGGPHVSALPVRTLAEGKAIDIAVKGEGDETISELLDAFENDRPLSTVKGIAYRDGGQVIENDDRALIKELGNLPLPSFHLLKYNLYRSYGWNKWVKGHRKPLGVIFTGRGCYGKCSFCATQSVFGRKIRFFPAERIKKELDLLVNTYMIKVLYFQDDTFTANRKMVREICDYIIEKGYHKILEIQVSTRPDAAHLETFKLMRRAGIRWVCFGVESGNQKVLDAMHKKTTIKQIENAFKMANDAGLFIAGNYMIGTLEETYETAMDTINLACRLKQDYASFAVAIPLPGTELYEHCIENGIELPSWNDFGSVNTPPIPLNRSLNAQHLMELRALATNKFFKRFGYLLRILRRFKIIAVLKDFTGMYLALRKEIKEKRY